MMPSQQAYAAQHYSPRATSYVTSAVHSGGEDLDQIEALMQGRASARVLDLGCGGGHVSYRAAPHVAEVVACDVTPAMLDAVAATAAERKLRNITVREAAAESLPFRESSFDVVLCRFSAHHWQNLEAGLREARRVLTPKGQAVFIDVTAPAEAVADTHLQAIELLRDPSHVRNYNLAEWIAALARSGFALEEVSLRRLRMEFPVWTARTRTPPAMAAAIRAVQAGASPAVRSHFAVAPDGSFDLEAATLVLRAA